MSEQETELSTVVTPIMEIATAQKVTGDQAALIAKELEPFANEASEWAKKAESINVTSIDQKEDIALAQESRRAIKKIRTAAAKRKAELKESALNYGRGLDAVMRHIESITKPIEAKLQESEDFVKRHYAKIHADMVASRSEAIEALGGNPLLFNIGTLTDDEFDVIIEGLKVQKKAEEDRIKREQEEAAEAERKRKEAEAKAEAERKAKEEAERAERERIEKENARLKAEAEERERIAAKEREEREAKELSERKKREEAERKAQAEREAEQEKQRKALEAERKKREEAERVKAAAERAERERIEKEAAERERQNSAKITEAAKKISDLLTIRAGEWADANPTIKGGKQKFIAEVIKNLQS